MGPGLSVRPERPASGFAEAGTIVGYRSTGSVAIGGPRIHSGEDVTQTQLELEMPGLIS